MDKNPRFHGDGIRDGLRAAIPAAVLSGIPSTIHALAVGRDPLEASLAAGSMLISDEQRIDRLLMAAVPVHLLIATTWAVIMATVLPGKRPIIEGVGAGLGIAVIDLVVIGRHFERIRALPAGPQIADHLAFGILVARSLAHQRRARA